MENNNSKFKILSNFVENVYFLATSDLSGNPNLIAVEINKITPKGEIIITNNHIIKSIKNITLNNKCVVLITDYKKIWWRIFGTATYQVRGK